MADTPEGLEKLGFPYSPDEVVLTINGKRVVQWMSINFERINPVNSWAPPSADGGHLAIHHADMQGRLTLELMQKSPSLQDILALATTKQPFTIAIKDKSGTPDIAVMTEALLETMPQLQRTATESNYRCQFIGVLHRVEGGTPAGT
jgi:hypothetical protein